MADANSITLVKPIETHPQFPGDVATMLTFREANGADIAACGLPVSDSMATPEFGGCMSAWISRLAQIPRSSVDQLHPADWMAAMTQVMRFLAPPAKPSAFSPSISTSGTP